MLPKIMLVGLGGLGTVTLELLAREATVGKIVVASRHQERGQARGNLALLGAMAQGFAPNIRFVSLDLNRQEAVADVVRREQPDLILSTATRQTWWLPQRLPPPQARRLAAAGFGMWLPVHLTLTLKLMQALKIANYQGLVLTAPFPDVINPILGKLGLAPTCGLGNLDEIVPKIQLLAARKLDVPPTEITVWLVAHHALQAYAFGDNSGERPPYYLRVEHKGKNVTGELDPNEVLFGAFPLTGGPASHFLTAGSTVRLVRSLLSAQETRLHTPSPGGLPGGYPVWASRDGVRVADIPGCTLNKAIEINQRSHRFDGIDRIDDDGTAIFRAESVQIMRETLGYNCLSLPPAEAEARAQELITRFSDFARRHGVDLDVDSRARRV